MLFHILFEEFNGKWDQLQKNYFEMYQFISSKSNKYLKQLFLRIVYVNIWNVNLFSVKVGCECM
jgi:hypothetical protein